MSKLFGVNVLHENLVKSFALRLATDVITRGWKDNGWDSPTIKEKNNPDRIEVCLEMRPVTETTTETPMTTTEIILRLIQGNPKITTKELAARCGITADGVAFHIKKLKLSGKIARVGGS